jgi:hypothetical protein
VPVFVTPAAAQNKKIWEGFMEELQKAAQGSAPAPAKK